MKKQPAFQISIPEPCHENWEVITVAERLYIFTLKKIVVLTFFISFSNTIVFAQQRKKAVNKMSVVTLSGHVIEIPSEKRLANVNVYLTAKGFSRNEKTDSNGAFTFSIPPVFQCGEAIIYVPDKTNAPAVEYFIPLAKSNKNIIVIYPKEDSLPTVRIRNHFTNGFAVATIISNVKHLGKERLCKPEFQHGDSGLYKYFVENMRYPSKALSAKQEGKLRVIFKINEDGYVSGVNVPRELGFGMDEEAIRLIRGMPKWKAATYNGIKIPYFYSIKFHFESALKIVGSPLEKNPCIDGQMIYRQNTPLRKRSILYQITHLFKKKNA